MCGKKSTIRKNMGGISLAEPRLTMFDKYFEIFLADNEAGRDIHYRLRYQVYCMETGYENPFAYPDRREKDLYDARSAHFIVRSRATGDWIAAMRLVVASADELPHRRVATIDNQLLNSFMLKATGETSGLCSEISRLCVVSQYRRRMHEQHTPYQVPWDPARESTSVGKSSSVDRRKAPWLKLGLIRAARDFSEENNIRYWFFLIADPLARILESLGVGLQLIGPPIDYRGLRRPYLRDLKWGYGDIPMKSREFFQMLNESNRYRLFSELGREDYKTPPGDSATLIAG